MSKNRKKAEEKAKEIPVEATEEQPVENEELKKLQEELDKKQQELDETIRLLQRNQADFENYRRRNNSVRAESYENGKRDAVSELLPSLDDFDRIILNADKADEAWVEGVKLVYRKFTEELKKLGLTEIEAEGKFDPNLHNAVLSEAAGQIVEGPLMTRLARPGRIGDDDDPGIRSAGQVEKTVPDFVGHFSAADNHQRTFLRSMPGYGKIDHRRILRHRPPDEAQTKQEGK